MAGAGTIATAAAQPWRTLLVAALESNAHLKHSSYFQLATVAANGKPANRTVVFRGFQEGCDNIHIHTDSRSSKIDEIKHCRYGEVCWYFTESWEQFRINGTLDVIDCSTTDPVKLQQREKSWFSCSLKSRFQYLGPVPRLPVLSAEPSKVDQLDSSSGPVDTFCLLIFDPEQVDYLSLKGNERILFRSRRSSSESRVWFSDKVNP
ncbi:Pyridoxine/pyridoxamine 5'-phosphate oxidase 2 [Apostasia shenzhenica]|uniref:pyridoxal 5'-phosphate synthase n=1 Tax=Apostasia shenzhenica TaxID=1088818 RepID=A0A2I0A918_9ASPA|nr:Pyridoxine/pyridoxamine 5'-phosphate oxidase 2 [Apostasia shenzhenica]